MRDRLLALLETADLAIASCAGVLIEDELASVKISIGALRTRLSYPDDILVVAFAGGTGSGKSSLLNAMAGNELVDVGGVRPTTSHPEAAIPRQADGALDGYLDFLGVAGRHTHTGGAICLIDLPDTDSVHIDHRHRVDALLPLVDVVVWVIDPEKYRDARLHVEYLRPLAAYASQFVFVLNQSDRLTEGQLMPVMADLSRALVEDGLEDVVVIATAASPRVGPPLGITELMDALEAKRDDRDSLYMKLLIDLEHTVDELASRLGDAVEYDVRAPAVADAAVVTLVDGDAPAATDALISFIDGLADEVGGVTAASLRRVADGVPQHVARISANARTDKPRRRRWLWREDPAGDAIWLRAQIDEAVLRPARALLAKRALAIAAVAELAIAAEDLRSTAPR